MQTKKQAIRIMFASIQLCPKINSFLEIQEMSMGGEVIKMHKKVWSTKKVRQKCALYQSLKRKTEI